eukprot:52838-Eustigmatos_ZCMA.PRE.1
MNSVSSLSIICGITTGHRWMKHALLHIRELATELVVDSHTPQLLSLIWLSSSPPPYEGHDSAPCGHSPRCAGT